MTKKGSTMSSISTQTKSATLNEGSQLGSVEVGIAHAGMSRMQSAARQLMLSKMAFLQHGSITLIEQFIQGEGTQTQVFGDSDHPLSVTIEVHHPDFYRKMLTGGSIAAGEAFMDGWWSSPNLAQVMELMALNLATLDAISQQSSWIKKSAYKVAHWLNRNTQANSKKNIHAHYDLGNDLYELFLDSKMLYSSAIYKSPQDTLEQAQVNKMDRLCQQLNLQQGERVIEIGTGWGAMAIYMAQNYGCHVTTTTISKEQLAYAKQRVQELGLEDRITLLEQDYRDLEGQFDKLVSIEMIEAVGKQFLKSYVQKCNQLLKPGGKMAIQAITIADQRYDHYSSNVDFIQKYIFPGGFLPSTTSLLASTTEYSQLVLKDLHDIGLDYAQTLADWDKRFNLSIESVKSQGYDERFIRMWRYYLAYCEGGFRAKSISTVQLTFDKAAS
jgi:cyclopropane-fatty-acyl-phospholipid synthase